MQRVKRSESHDIFKKRSGTYAVRTRSKRREWVGGVDKLKLLVDAGFLKKDVLPKEKPAEPEEVVEAAPAAEAEAAPEEAKAEEVKEEKPAEEAKAGEPAEESPESNKA